MEQKFRFKLNLFDGIVLVLCLCVGGFLAYSYLKPAPAVTEDPAVPSASTVRYVVKFQKMLEGTETLVESGDKLTDNIKNYDLGTVVSTEVIPCTTRVEDHINRQVVRAEIPGHVDLLVTVESDSAALGTDAVVLDGGYNLRVNTTAYIKGEGYMASGPIISIEREGQA